MRGKLAKAIRREVGFHPAGERRYELVNAFRWWTGEIVGTTTAVEGRRRYQDFKRGVLATKRAAV